MTQLAAITEAAQPRARGEVEVSAKRRGPASVIDGLKMAGSMKALFPRTDGDALDVMLINTAGGVTGGDGFRLALGAGADAEMTVTTQAAERAYAARDAVAGRVETRLVVEAGARLNWLPQETILFNACHFQRSLSVDLAAGARFLMVEPLILGRVAMGEHLRAGRFRDRVSIRRDGRPIYHDAVRLEGDISAATAKPAVMNGARAMVAVVFAAPEAEAYLERARDLMPETGGVSLLAPDLLVCRIVAEDGFALRKALVPLIRLLNRDEIPRPWML